MACCPSIPTSRSSKDTTRSRWTTMLSSSSRAVASTSGPSRTGSPTPAAKRIAAAYFRDHVKELLERYPNQDDDARAELASVFLGGCDAESRDELAAFHRATFGGFTGAERIIAKGLERLDSCIAQRRLLAPRYEA